MNLIRALVRPISFSWRKDEVEDVNVPTLMSSFRKPTAGCHLFYWSFILWSSTCLLSVTHAWKERKYACVKEDNEVEDDKIKENSRLC